MYTRIISTIIILASVLLIPFAFAYTAPSYDNINLELEGGYTSPDYQNIDLVLGEKQNCWTKTDGKLIIPPNCTYYTNVKEGIPPL